MVVEPQKTTVAFRCPHCGCGVMSAVSLFSVKGSMVRLKCDCGKSEMDVVPDGNGKVRLTVPCIICPNPHHFTVSEKILFDSELFVLPCPYTDLNIAMMGEVNHVKAELSRTELQLLDLMEEHGIADFSALHDSEKHAMPDPQILDIVLFVIHDLDAEGKITCKCQNAGEGEYDAEILPEGVRVSCRKCGAATTIATDSFLKANDFLNCESLNLT